MKSLINKLIICVVLGAAVNLNAQSVTLDPSQNWLGYMNVFDLGNNFQFGSTWGTSDLTATFAGSTLTLGPNAVNDPNSYWYTPSGGPGATGNKIMDASMYVETTGTYVNTTLTFSGDVSANTLGGETAAGNGIAWTTVAFIKDFAPDYSSFTSTTTSLVPGDFTISLPTGGTGDHVQYGFETIGSDVWATDVGQYGSVVINPVPEPSILALAGLGGVALGFSRRRKD
jgi:hypothetical protein